MVCNVANCYESPTPSRLVHDLQFHVLSNPVRKFRCVDSPLAEGHRFAASLPTPHTFIASADGHIATSTGVQGYDKVMGLKKMSLNLVF